MVSCTAACCSTCLPESAWVTLLEEADSASGPDADVVGRWDIDVEREMAPDPAAARMSRTIRSARLVWRRMGAVDFSKDGDRLVATAGSQLGLPEAETVAVSGRALFLRFLVPFPILMTAVVDGDRMHGQTETSQGDIFHFTATRSNQEQ